MNKKIVPVVIALIHKDGKYLMTKRIITDKLDMDYYPYAWNLPGGGLEFGEQPEQTLTREIKEELNIEIIDIIPVSKVYTSVRKNWQGIFICFICKMKNEDDKITLDLEASEYNWFTLEEAKKVKTFEKTIEMITEADKIIGK